MPKSESLKQGLEKSADKKGLTGKERQRYIGGSIRKIKCGPGTSTPKKASSPTNTKEKKTTKTTRKTKASTPPPKPREKLVLVVKKNGPASKTRSYDVYSLYKEGSSTPYNNSTYRKRSAAQEAAKAAMAAHNHPLGVHTQHSIK